MRQRILCLVLLGLLVAPAVVLAKGSVIDPNGTPAHAAVAELITVVEKGSEIDPNGAPILATAYSPATVVEEDSAGPTASAPWRWGAFSRSLARFGLFL